jgi:hypothetical protein
MEHEIDLVYLWVDGSDGKWLKKRDAYIGNISHNAESLSKARHADNDELKYSLRSAEKYAPWIRKIFIVTDEQMPEWLDTSNPKIKIIDHKEILPEICRPCFNSPVIEYFLYRIPDLSEYFLYANDDMFFNSPAKPDFFFAGDGYPVIRLRRKPFGKWHYKIKSWWKKEKLETYGQKLHKVASLIERRYGKYYADTPHHNIDAYRKSIFKEVIENIFWNEVKETLANRFRNGNDIQRAIILYYMLATKKGHPKHIDKSRESYVIRVKRPDFMALLTSHNPSLFCLNDCPQATDKDRERVKPFLEALFPGKSQFEK